MAYCTKCGACVNDGAKFCGKCGSKMEPNIDPTKQAENKKDGNQRKTKFEGELHKCPNCGIVLDSFVKNCPECGYELRGASGVESVQEFAQRYSIANSNSQKIDLIRTFVIPNTKEDILEFVILASSNIDTTTYTKDNAPAEVVRSRQEVTEAWMAKFEQAYQKATLLLGDSLEINRINKLYQDKIILLNKAKKASSLKKTSKVIIAITLGLLSIIMIALGYTLEVYGVAMAGLMFGTVALFFCI